jgi:nanoRNase/pAp phosphatase (c-di-AMP/oligoRNAs hydrolase)
MDNTIVQKIKDALSQNDNIAIVTGKNPSIDEMAAALSLYLLLKENKKVTIACPTQPIVELSNLVGIDKVATKLEGSEGDLVVSFPYVEGEVEKVSYTLESGFLNIIVKASDQGLTFDEKDVKYSKGGATFSLLFAIGTPRLSDLGDLINPDKLRNTKIINIDNKQENEAYGEIIAVSSDFSSVSEQVADLVLSLGLRLDRDIAQNLLDGINFATQNFQSPATSPLAFELASLLMRNGAQRTQRGNTSSPIAQRKYPSQRYSQEAQPDQKPANTSRRSLANKQQNNQIEEPDQKAPNDWLAPKVYKGSSNF